MNVLVIHPSLNDCGGSERVCIRIIEALKEKGYNVTLGTFEKTNWEKVSKFFDNVKKPDVEFVRPKFFGASAYEELLNFYALSLRISNNYEAIVVSCASPWLFCPNSKKTIIYMNIAPVNHIKGFRRAYISPYVFLQKRAFKKGNTVILTNSSFSSKIIKEVYSLRPMVVYPPVDVDKFQPTLKKENLVVSVGRFDPYKGYEKLIMAFSNVKFGKCAILGNIYDYVSLKYFKKLKHLVNYLKLDDKVELIVNCSFAKLRHFLSKAKVYVHSALFEFFGISVVEAMASGCVPIVHKSGGPYTDIIARGTYGFAFENVRELADNINLLLEDETLFRDFSYKAIGRSKFFSKKSFKEKFLSLAAL